MDLIFRNASVKLNCRQNLSYVIDICLSIHLNSNYLLFFLIICFKKCLCSPISRMLFRKEIYFGGEYFVELWESFLRIFCQLVCRSDYKNIIVWIYKREFFGCYLYWFLGQASKDVNFLAAIWDTNLIYFVKFPFWVPFLIFCFLNILLTNFL